MGSIVLITLLFLIGALFLWYDVLRRIQEKSKSEADLLLEKMLREQENFTLTPEQAEDKKFKGFKPLDKLAGIISGSWLLESKGSQDLIGWLDQQLMYAGITRDRGLTAQDVLGYVIVYWILVIGILSTIVFALGFPAIIGLLLMLILVAFPYFRLRGLRLARQEKALFELPMFLQDMILNLSAGATTIDDALGAVVEENLNASARQRKILAEEFGQAYVEYRNLGRSQDEALRDVGTRLGVQSINDFIDILIQGLNTGYAIRPLLVAQSEQVQKIWKQEMRTYIGRKESAFVISTAFIMLGVFVMILAALFIRIFAALSGTVG